MKTKIYTVTFLSYTEQDNYLYTEAPTVTADEQQALAKYREMCAYAFEAARNPNEADEQDDDYAEQIFPVTEDRSEGDTQDSRQYTVSRAQGTQDGYTARVTLEVQEVDVPMPQEVEVLCITYDDNTKGTILAMHADDWKNGSKREAIESELKTIWDDEQLDDIDDMHDDELGTRREFSEAVSNLASGLPAEFCGDELYFETLKMI